MGTTQYRRKPRPHLRHHPARRRAVARHLAEHRREGRDRPAARPPGRRRDRGRLPDHLARRLRGGRGDRPQGRGPGDLRPRPHPQGRHRRRLGRDQGRRAARASTPSSRPPTSTSSTSCRPTARTSRARRGPRSRWPSPTARTSSSRRWTRPAPTSSSPPRSARSRSRRARPSINIPDTVGYTTPEEYADVLPPPLRAGARRCARSRSRSTATTTWAWPSPTPTPGVLAGARQVECAVNGIGERAGNCSLEEIVMLLRTREDVHGLDTGINTRELARTSRMVSRLTGYAVQPNKAIVGRNAFAHESGIHQDGVLKERTHLRDHGRDRGRPGVELDRARQALRPPRPAGRAGAARLQGRGQRPERRLQALQGGRRPQEAGDRARPGGDRLRRDARARRRPRAGLVRGRGRLASASRWPGSRSTLPSGEEVGRRVERRRPGRRDLPRDPEGDRAPSASCASTRSRP